MRNKAGIKQRLAGASLALVLALMVLVPVTSLPCQGAQGSIYVDGVRLEGASPVLIDGSNLVPMRVIFERLGAAVKWEGASQTVTATRGDREVVDRKSVV